MTISSCPKRFSSSKPSLGWNHHALSLSPQTATTPIATWAATPSSDTQAGIAMGVAIGRFRCVSPHSGLLAPDHSGLYDAVSSFPIFLIGVFVKLEPDPRGLMDNLTQGQVDIEVIE